MIYNMWFLKGKPHVKCNKIYTIEPTKKIAGDQEIGKPKLSYKQKTSNKKRKSPLVQNWKEVHKISQFSLNLLQSCMYIYHSFGF